MRVAEKLPVLAKAHSGSMIMVDQYLVKDASRIGISKTSILTGCQFVGMTFVAGAIW